MNKESLEELLTTQFYIAIINLALEKNKISSKMIAKKLQVWYKSIKKIEAIAKKAKYRVGKIRELL